MKHFHVLVIIILTAVLAAAQTNERVAAIQHYLNGNDIEAILALEALLKKKEYAADAGAINYLGLAYKNALDEKNARKMFEKAVKLQPASSVYRSNLALTVRPGTPDLNIAGQLRRQRNGRTFHA